LSARIVVRIDAIFKRGPGPDWDHTYQDLNEPAWKVREHFDLSDPTMVTIQRQMNMGITIQLNSEDIHDESCDAALDFFVAPQFWMFYSRGPFLI
jgi:hypothetical protein